MSSKRRAMPSSSWRPPTGSAPTRAAAGRVPPPGRRRAGGQFVGQGAAQGAQGGGERGEGQSVGADLDAAAEGDDGAPAAGGRANSSTRRVLPTPASPPMSNACGSPAAARASASFSDVQLVGAADEDGADGPGLHGRRASHAADGQGPADFAGPSPCGAADPRTAAPLRGRSVFTAAPPRGIPITRRGRRVCDSPARRRRPTAGAARAAASRRAARAAADRLVGHAARPRPGGAVRRNGPGGARTRTWCVPWRGRCRASLSAMPPPSSRQGGAPHRESSASSAAAGALDAP